MRPYDSRKKFDVDGVLVWPDLWISIHAWAEASARPLPGDRVTWLDFSIVEQESQDPAGAPFYPEQPHSRPSRNPVTDAREAGDRIGKGFIKWDGCMEIQIDHHFCTTADWTRLGEAILRLRAWAVDNLGFEVE